jgi:serine/threonine protein kinase
MKLYKYSRVFVEDGLSEPYCKFFLIFEYCESSLRNEILHHQKQKRTYRRSALKKVLVALAEAIDFLHERRQYHGDLRTEKIFKMESGEYKIMPPRVKPRQQ